MTDYPITRFPQLLFDGYSSTLSLKNNDTTNFIYLGESTTKCQQGQGLPLGPLSTVTWDANRPLWAVSPTLTGTNQISLSAVANTGAVFSPGDLASQILTQGLAQQIASDISITGAPPIDNPTLLNSSGAFLSPGFQTPIFVTSTFQSMRMVLNPGLPAGNVLITVQWLTLDGATVLGSTQVISGASSAIGHMVANFPVLGPACQITYNVLNGGTTLGFSAVVYGSYRATNSVSFRTYSGGSTFGGLDGDGDQGLQTWSGSIPVSTTVTWQPTVIAGPAKLTLRWTNGVPTAGFVIVLFRVPTIIYSLTTLLSPYLSSGAPPTAGTIIPASQTDVFDVYLPPIPMELSIQNFSSTANIGFRATLVNANPYAV